MYFDTQSYTTKGGIFVSRSVTNTSIDSAIDEVLIRLDSQRGGLLASSYEYPGRYKRWAIGFVNPPLELVTRDHTFTITAHNERGKILLDYLAECLLHQPYLEAVKKENNSIIGSVKPTERLFSEEERSRQPSVFSVVREILSVFDSPVDENLGLYGAFGYDLVFQFEQMPKRLERSSDQRDVVLYLPDELLVIDYHLQQAFRVQYDFVTKNGSTRDLPRTGEVMDYRGKRLSVTQNSDHAPGEYEQQVIKALDYFRRGDLFEVVPSQSFFQACEKSPTELFRTLREINPSPYGFLFNLGGEYLIGASPEMFVRVDGRRVETCPISGTIRRGETAIDDAAQIQKLLNSRKDESELTMCTDVDRNDKSRICESGTVRVIGRRQIELYSHLIHTVDHVEGIMRPEFDALDAFLTHLWAVTVTGAPKRSAMQFLEQNERSPRRWYGGAVGYLNFTGNLNTGLILRTIRLKTQLHRYESVQQFFMTQSQKRKHKKRLLKLVLYSKHFAQWFIKVQICQVCQTLTFKKRIQGRAKRVLLVDYEDSFVHTLANYIRQTGATVTTLRHGFAESLFDAENLTWLYYLLVLENQVTFVLQIQLQLAKNGKFPSLACV